jgi:hypothetical protein
MSQGHTYIFNKIKGDDSATLKTPPHHKIFDTVSESTKSKPSLVQCWKDAQGQAAMSQGLVINFIVQPELFGCPSVTPANPTTSNTSGIPPINSPLFSAVLKPVVLLFLNDFCAIYHLSPEVLMHFTKNGFMTLNQLCYILVADLKEIKVCLSIVTLFLP